MSNPMTTTPTDPTAIDLDALKTRWNTYSFSAGPRKDGAALIAAVEALQEDLAGYNTVFDLARERERPWISKWRIASGKPKSLPDYGEMLDWLCSQIEAAEARGAVLAEVLEAVRPFFEGEHSYDHPDCVQIRAALATTPAQATERARAKAKRLKVLEDCASVLRYYARNEIGEVVRRALAKLDALGTGGP